MSVLTTVCGQNKTVRHFKSLTISQGLSQGYISDITQDKNGMIWITTSDGLNKYDGYKFSVFHNDIQDTTSIGSDDLTCLREDTQGRLWVGTRNSGLDIFDQGSHSFRHFRSKETGGLRSDRILGIKEDKTGTLWIRTVAGIDRLDIKTDSVTGVQQYFFNPVILPETDEEIHENIFIDSRNRIFITTRNAVLEYIHTNITGGYRLIKRFGFNPVRPEFIPELIEDTVNHSLLLNNGSLIRFPDYNFSYPQVLLPTTRENIAWTFDMSKALWVAGQNAPLEIDPQSGSAANISPQDPLHMKALSNPSVYFTDRNGIVWLGSAGYGILMYDPEVEKFHHMLAGKTTYQLLEYNPGVIMTNNFDLIDLNNQHPGIDSSFSRFFQSKKNRAQLQPVTFAKDGKNTLWFGSESTLNRYNPSGKQITSVQIPFTDVASVPYPVHVDRNGQVWMGYKKWLVRYEIQTNQFYRYAYPGLSFQVDFDFLQCICEDNGVMWLGTSNGLYCFDIETAQMKQPYFAFARDTASISNNFILSFCPDVDDPARFLWIGTKGGGLNKLDKFSGKFQRFTTRQGIPNNVVYGIVGDYDHNLWLSTNRGLCAFNVKTGMVRNFDVTDGLQGNEFNRYAFAKSTNGLLIFGGLNGINYFNPRKLIPLPAPSVVLTELRLFNKPVNTGPGSILTTDINYTSQLKLLHEQNVVTFRFAGNDFRRHENIRYRYKMLGFDKDWIYAEGVNEATYTNLDAGDYKFSVQASYDNNSWPDQAKEIDIYVMAPWWQTWWFKMFVIIGTVSVAYTLYRYRIHQLGILESLRNRIARDLHDEVGSSISTIAIYSKIVHEQMENKTFNNETLLQKISENAKEIMESMNDIIWNINTKNDGVENIINRIREHAVQLLEAKEYELHFEFDESLYQMQLPMEKRRDFYLIYKEALNNIAKYADGRNVWISMKMENEQLLFTIKDDGKGFDLKARGKAGNGVTNMQHRAKMLGGKLEMISQPGIGTEIRLVF